MFERIAGLMKVQARVQGWKDLVTGSMTDTVYPCNGAMEDWAYGAAWDTSSNSRTTNCNPRSYLPFIPTEYFTRYEHIKPAIYLIEASDRKHPLESKFGGDGDIYCQNCPSDGHINRFIRMSLAFIDVMQVYPVVTNFVYANNNSQVMISWKINGCLTLNSAKILVQDSATKQYETHEKLGSQLGHCNWEGRQTQFIHFLSLNDNMNTEVRFKLQAVADQDFLQQSNPDPRVGPQTYVTLSRSTNTQQFAQTQKSFVLL